MSSFRFCLTSKQSPLVSHKFSLQLEISVTKRKIVLQIHNELCDNFADLDCFGRLRHTDNRLRDWP